VDDFPQSVRFKINAVLQELDAHFNSIIEADLNGRLVKQYAIQEHPIGGGNDYHQILTILILESALS
jgi:hypothetical protein